ncbi:MAG: MaoC family dehydratase N-terminal domain-containing protein [Actinobacteria bacterium]|nr:MaoC family dehydratase N-terminal domain-containing protein [Actinomycetota bacterium]MBW3648994.1 MaoC family dehydratase N-terminal domain-containing protein [Actinomycetota bacterium]
MALPLDKLGTTYEAGTATIEPERAIAYAAATNDDNPAYAAGKFAPPVFGVVPTWAALGLAVADVVPPDALMMIVHGEQDMHFHQPLVPGRRILTRSQAYSVRVGTSGTRYTVKVSSEDAKSTEAVLEQYVTMFIRGMADGEGAGPDKPDHTLTPDHKGSPLAQFTVHVDEDQTFRYRDASGDQMPIHVDEAFAKSVGLPGIIAHGLCSMAMTSQAVIKTVADGDPARLKRLAVRFSRNVFPGDDLTTTIYDLGLLPDGRHSYGFEATTSRGDTAITNGRAEIEP